MTRHPSVLQLSVVGALVVCVTGCNRSVVVVFDVPSRVSAVSIDGGRVFLAGDPGESDLRVVSLQSEQAGPQEDDDRYLSAALNSTDRQAVVRALERGRFAFGIAAGLAIAAGVGLLSSPTGWQAGCVCIGASAWAIALHVHADLKIKILKLRDRDEG